MTKIIAEDMFATLAVYNRQIAHATAYQRWEDFKKAREELDKWFAERGVELVSRTEGKDSK